MKSLQILVVFQFLGFSSSLPVIHNPLTKFHDSRIYFHNSVNPFGKFSREPDFSSLKYRDNFFHHLQLGNVMSYDDYNDMDERIHFPAQNIEEIGFRQFGGDPNGNNEPILFEPDVQQTRFRHALDSESESEEISTTEPSTESPPKIAEENDDEEQTPADQIQSTAATVPLSYLERWARQHSMSSSEKTGTNDKTESPSSTASPVVDQSAIIFDDNDKDEHEKSFSFQSFLQIPRLNANRASVSLGDCPPKQVRNHRGKCVKTFRIIVFETEDEDSKEER